LLRGLTRQKTSADAALILESWRKPYFLPIYFLAGALNEGPRAATKGLECVESRQAMGRIKITLRREKLGPC
jgi:hypothetical protein